MENFFWSLFSNVSEDRETGARILHTIDTLSNSNNFIGLHTSETLLQFLDKHRKWCLDVHWFRLSRKCF